MYNPKSSHAEEFIDHAEIMETLDYASRNRSNRPLIEEIINKAATCKGLTHREAAVLLECDQPDLVERFENLADRVVHAVDNGLDIKFEMGDRTK